VTQHFEIIPLKISPQLLQINAQMQS